MAKAVSKLGDNTPKVGDVLMYGEKGTTYPGYVLVVNRTGRVPLNSVAALKLQAILNRPHIKQGTVVRIDNGVLRQEKGCYVMGNAAEYGALIDGLREDDEVEYNE